ncbi:MAG: helix-turn-helix domain-containing protein, partial [Clostridia bacterium]|nr:helix-turn-helix domain-containing protein [Clostridia bacterium]
MIKDINNSHSHLTLDERRIILAGITNGSTKTAIAQNIGKDKSTIGKEIKLHRTI